MLEVKRISITTFEEAVEQQLRHHERLPRNWRYASLRDGYTRNPSSAFGDTDILPEHTCTMQWDPSGHVLLCTICFVDGT